MSKKPSVPKERWTVACSEEISRPKSPEWLSRAVEHLGPFAHKTKAAIQRGSFYEDEGKRFGISEELALELVEELARRFNTERHLARNAPRFSHVAQRLRETARLADALASHLESLDDITRHELQIAGTTPEYQQRFSKLRAAADVDALPRIATDENLAAEQQWTQRLRSLSKYARATLENATHWRCFGQRDAQDRGGNADLWKENFGKPEWGLVNDAILTFEIFKPGEATGTEGGPLHEFILAVYEYATGREGNEYARVEDWLKQLVKPNRVDRELKAEEARLQAEEERIFNSKPMTKADEARVAEIFAAQRAIRRQRECLWRKTWPHLRFRPSGD